MSRRKRKFQQEAQQRLRQQDDTAQEVEITEQIQPRTPNQAKYIQAIREKDFVSCTGPAGSGKSFLGIALALQFLREGKVNKIVLTRPVVEAGEKLGFLPGTAQEKIDPYLRPVYDALSTLLGPDQYRSLIARDVIQIIPLAYMRGITFENAFIILDEAQNTTVEQIIMAITRLGQGSKMICNGDIQQIDLPSNKKSGLVALREIVGYSTLASFIEFTDEDVVRHPFVREVVKGYAVWKQVQIQQSHIHKEKVY